MFGGIIPQFAGRDWRKTRQISGQMGSDSKFEMHAPGRKVPTVTVQYIVVRLETASVTE